MIIYDPTNGEVISTPLESRPQHCFLMTQLGGEIPKEVTIIRKSITTVCSKSNYTLIDANSEITGRDFLLKIWKLIATTPLSIVICHEDMPPKTLSNIYYELGVAQAMGKETVIIKSPKADVPSDFVRTEYIEYDGDFNVKFSNFLKGIHDQAGYYETIAEQLERDPVLSLDYLKRAYLITGDTDISEKMDKLVEGLGNRAKSSVEKLLASS